MMVLNEENVVFWFQGLKGHERIPFLRQLVNMCHPLELRFITLCVEDACRTDYLAFRTYDYQANDQNVLQHLTNPMDVDVRSRIIIYLCLLNSSNKLCSRILNQKICDHDAVSQFCDDVLEHVRFGDPPKLHELRTLEELRLLYTLAYLHPAFDFSERQHFKSICTRLQELDRELASLERRQPADFSALKSNCDGGSQPCSLCFSTSSAEHICKLRLLRRSARPDGVFENQVNVQWSTGKWSNLTIADTQLHQLHTTLEGIISQPQLPAFPGEPGPTHLNAYLQHLQGLSAFTWPRSQSVFNFFKTIANDQEQRMRPPGSPRPHSVYTPRGGSPGDADTPCLALPVQNGTAESGDDSSESSPPVLDDEAELKSYTIYNSSVDAATRAGSRSPLAPSLRSPVPAAVPGTVPTPRSPEPPGSWPPLPGAASPTRTSVSPALLNGHVPALARPAEPRASAQAPPPPGQAQEASARDPAAAAAAARSPDAERLTQMLADLGLRKHTSALLPYTLTQLRAFSGERFSELGLTDGAVRRFRLALEAAMSPSASASASGGSTATQRRRAQRALSRSRAATVTSDPPESPTAPTVPPLSSPRPLEEAPEEEVQPLPVPAKAAVPPAAIRVSSSIATYTTSTPVRVTSTATPPVVTCSSSMRVVSVASVRVSSAPSQVAAASAQGTASSTRVVPAPNSYVTSAVSRGTSAPPASLIVIPGTASATVVGTPTTPDLPAAVPGQLVIGVSPQVTDIVPRPPVHRQSTGAGLPSSPVVMPAPLTVVPSHTCAAAPPPPPGGQAPTLPTYSAAVTARSEPPVQTPHYADGGRAALLENHLVFTMQSTITPPAAPLVCSPYRPPLPPLPPGPKSAASSPSPPSASPGPPPHAHAPVYLPRPAFLTTRPPPSLPAHLGAFVYTAGGGPVSGFLHSAAAFPGAAHEIGYHLGPQFYATPYPHHHAMPRAPMPPPLRPPRYEACYNCGSDEHLGRYCSADAAAGDASLNSQNQFKIYLAPTTGDK